MSKYIIFILLLLTFFIPYNVNAHIGVNEQQQIKIPTIGESGYFTESESVYYTGGNQYYIGQEIIEKRTENSKTVYLGKSGINERFSTVVSVAPIHYKDNYNDPYEQWKDIDLTIVNGRMTKAPYELTINLNTIIIRDKKTNSITALTLGGIGDKSVTLPSPLMEIGNKAIAYNIATDTDLEIVADGTSVKFTRILKSNKAPVDCMFGVSQNGNGLKISTMALDSKTTDDKSIKVTSLLKDGTLTETIDSVTKSKLTYPVRIDPSISVLVTTGTDDAWTSSSDSGISTTGVYLLIGHAGNPSFSYYTWHLRFANITIPNASDIDSANITFTGYNAASGDTLKMHIQAEQSTNGATFTTYANAVGRTLTTAYAQWDFTTDWIDGGSYVTPSLKTVMQELVDDYSGLTCANITFHSVDDGSSADATRAADSYETSTTTCPKLQLEYTVPPAAVTTTAASSVEETSATMGGNVTETGGGNITQYGVQYGNVTGYGSWQNVSEVRTAAFVFSNSTTGLTHGEKYYFRAFANFTAGGFTTGSQLNFMTKPDEPTGFTAVVSTNGTNQLDWTLGDGSQKTMVRYRTDGSYPTSVSDGTEAYFDTLNTYAHSGLTGGTTYHYRMWSYATEDGSTQYSDSYASANVMAVSEPTVTTSAATSVEEDTATLNGAISVTGGNNSITRGFQYDVDSGAPYALDTHTHGDYGAAAYTAALAALTKGDKYYFRAYAINSAGTGYGSELTFITKPDEPNTLAAGGGNRTTIDLTWVKGTGAGYTIIKYADGAYPATVAAGTLAYNGTGVAASVYGLTVGHTYYFRAWSWASEGGLSVYSDTYDETFMLRLPDSVNIDTSAASLVTSATARLNSNLIDDGGEAVAVRFGYSNISQTVFANYGGANGTITTWSAGNYTTGQLPYIDLTGLSSNMTYYFNVDGQNTKGDSYGSEKSFTTVSFDTKTCPIYFSGIPSSSTIDLQWAKTGDLAYVKLYYQTSSIPTSNSTGILIYTGADNYFQHTGLSSGTSYGYRIYGYEASEWSTNSATAIITTLPASSNTTGISAPTAPSSLFITPNSTFISYIPLHELFDANATAIGMPAGNFYLIIVIIVGIIIGLFVYNKSKDELIATIALCVVFGFGTLVSIVPLWITIGTCLLIIPIWAIRRRA